MSVSKLKVCSICQKFYSGNGNNANPVNGGLCCDECNVSVVVPARINKINRLKK